MKLTEINKLIVFGSGAVALNGPKSIEPPIYNRYSWNVNFEESLIFYNDPTRYLSNNIALGWCVGTEKEYYLETISEIIKKIVKNYNNDSYYKKNIKFKDILFYGSSGGGFTSIILSTLIKDSKALVNNSQLIIKNYYEAHVSKMKKACFSELSDEEIFNNYGYRLNVLEAFKKEGYIPPITYYVNSNSSHDIDKQCIPFIKGLKELNIYNENNNVEIIFYTDDNGHSPMSKSKTIKVIKKTVNYEANYNYFNKVKLLKKELQRYKTRKIVKIVDKLLKIKNKIMKNKTV